MFGMLDRTAGLSVGFLQSLSARVPFCYQDMKFL
jgi:hypothetical protein